MSQTADVADVQAPEPEKNKSQVGVLIAVTLVWTIVLLVAYGIADGISLTAAIITMFVIGFPWCTVLFYRARGITSKHVVKALDYVTLLTFATGLVAVSEIDTRTFKERAALAATNVSALQIDLQDKLARNLEHCDDYKIKFEFKHEMLSLDYVQKILASVPQFIVCYELSDLRGIDLSNVSVETLQRRMSSLFHALPILDFDRNTAETFEALEYYTKTLLQLQPANPIGKVISPTLAYLLVAFAFCIRLTRTTLEVFEWYVQ